MNKKLLIVLGVSLAANFIFIGFETAKIIYQPAFPDIPPERPGFIDPDELRQDPDFQDKALLRSAFKSAVKIHKKEMEAARLEVEEALKTDPFNTEQFKSAMQKANVIRSAIDAAVQENMMDLLSKMTPEDRQNLADRFSRKAPFKALRKKDDKNIIHPDRFSLKHHNRPPHEFLPRPDPLPPESFDQGYPPVPPCLQKHMRHMRGMHQQPPCPAMRPCAQINTDCPPCVELRKCGKNIKPKKGPENLDKLPPDKINAKNIKKHEKIERETLKDKKEPPKPPIKQ